MKRQSIQNAYRNICPNEEAKERMLKNILLSSEIPPAGKDERKMRKKMKPMVIAAIIVVMIAMMGCAVLALSLQDMKIGEYINRGQVLDSEGKVVKETIIVRDVISLQGYGDSPNMLAAKEWYEFKSTYDMDSKLAAEADDNDYDAPDEYDAYGVYTQEMIDKVDQIAAKFGLKLAGSTATIQRWENELFFEALGITALHNADTQAEVEYYSGYFYECGNFDFDFDIRLTGADTDWPYGILTTIRYADKEYLDTVILTVEDISSLEQWHYTTAAGSEVLIAMNEEYARIFCDREDAFISVLFDAAHVYDSGETKLMSKADVERVADVIDFTLKPQKPDMDAVKLKLAQSEAQMQEKQEQEQKEREEYGYREFIADRIEALDNPEELYYTLIDIDQNDIVDLLLGSRNKCEVAWTIAYDEDAGSVHMNFVPLTEEEWKSIDEAWPNMEIYPITTYPMED